MEYQILTYPDAKLRQKSKEVALEQIPSLLPFIQEMILIMSQNDGVGLAAPQIGVAKRIIVISANVGPRAMINPKIRKKSLLKEIDEEGCLSVPGVQGLVKRHKSIVVEAFAENGEKINFTAKGLLARIIQHEIDHLDGILFIDKAKKLNNENRIKKN